jgi:hypothetical protein
LYFSEDIIIRVFRSKRMREMGTCTEFYTENLMGRDRFRNLRLCGRLTLKWTFRIELDQWRAVVNTVRNLQFV